MRRWLFTLAGLIVWFAHFMGVYAIASLADTVSRADDAGWRMVSLAFSGLCLAAVAGLLVLAARRALFADQEPGPAFMAQLSILGSGIALVAIVWQALPNLIGY
ncbi:MAG TPA: hypothetical protein VEA44_13315 [Caulobacter sp.]|nr:hypothetical protein [Caulobacter sp.]